MKNFKHITGKERDEIIDLFQEKLGPSWCVRSDDFLFGDTTFFCVEGKADICYVSTKRTYNEQYKQIVQRLCGKKKSLFPYKKRILYIGEILKQQKATTNGSVYEVVIQYAGF